MGNVGTLVNESLSSDDRMKRIHELLLHVVKVVDGNFDDESSREILDEIENRLDELDERMRLSVTMTDVDERLSNYTANFEEKNEKYDTRLSTLEGRLCGFQNTWDDVFTRLTKVESYIDVLFNKFRVADGRWLSSPFTHPPPPFTHPSVMDKLQKIEITYDMVVDRIIKLEKKQDKLTNDLIKSLSQNVPFIPPTPCTPLCEVDYDN